MKIILTLLALLVSVTNVGYSRADAAFTAIFNEDTSLQSGYDNPPEPPYDDDEDDSKEEQTEKK